MVWWSNNSCCAASTSTSFVRPCRDATGCPKGVCHEACQYTYFVLKKFKNVLSIMVALRSMWFLAIFMRTYHVNGITIFKDRLLGNSFQPRQYTTPSASSVWFNTFVRGFKVLLFLFHQHPWSTSYYRTIGLFYWFNLRSIRITIRIIHVTTKSEKMAPYFIFFTPHFGVIFGASLLHWPNFLGKITSVSFHLGCY